MSENKSFWAKLKSWIDGDEVIINADEYISTRERKEKVIGFDPRNEVFRKIACKAFSAR